MTAYFLDILQKQQIDCPVFHETSILYAQKDGALSYYGSAREYYIAGDCTGPEDVMKATQTAFATAVKV